MPLITTNKRAYFDYEILESLEAGLVLTGQEVKSIKKGQISLKGSYVTVHNNEAYLIGAHISAYQPQNVPQDYKPTHSRKLLLHKTEIKTLIGKLKTKGLTLVPLKVYTKRGKIKLEVGLGRGKRTIDKREKIKKREDERKIAQILKSRG